jgi:hypothetical protein
MREAAVFAATRRRKTVFRWARREWWRDTIHSDRAYYKETKCEIKRFWGRNFLDHDGPPPAGDSAPLVACTNGDTIRSVVDPTALAFDNQGNLLVADNGPDQNIKFFSLKPAKFLRTFGDSGGVFARSRPGAKTAYLPGQVGDRRFWGIRGLAVDSTGILYVGNTGIPMQTMGGTNIRAFAPTPDSSLLWQNHGLAFVNTADADPLSNGQDLYLNAKRFRMDYSKKPGESWTFTAVTLDPFRFAKDVRLTTPMESVWERRIEGKRFQYHTNMVGGFVYVVRFEDTSEIGIPTAMFCTYGDRTMGVGATALPCGTGTKPTSVCAGTGWIATATVSCRKQNMAPTRTGTCTARGWMWTRTATSGWVAGETPPVTSGLAAWRASRLVHWMPTGCRPSMSGRSADGASPTRKARAARSGSSMSWGEIACFWPKAPTPGTRPGSMSTATSPDLSKQEKVCRIDLGYDSKGQTEIHLDQGTDVMTLPFSFTADSEYVYVGYLDNGRFSRQRCEATVYSASTCQPVGWMAPDSPIPGRFRGDHRSGEWIERGRAGRRQQGGHGGRRRGWKSIGLPLVP